MERYSEKVTSEEAIRLVKALASQENGAELSSQTLAELLGVPEEQVVAEVREYRVAKKRPAFVDRSGIISFAISMAIVVVFITATILFHQTHVVSTGTTTVVAAPSAASSAAPADDHVVVHTGPGSSSAPASGESVVTSSPTTNVVGGTTDLTFVGNEPKS